MAEDILAQQVRLDLAPAFDASLTEKEGIIALDMAPIWRVGNAKNGRLSIPSYSNYAKSSSSDIRPNKGPAAVLNKYSDVKTWYTEPHSYVSEEDIKQIESNPNRKDFEDLIIRTNSRALWLNAEAAVLAAFDAAVSATSQTASPSVKWNHGSTTTIRADIFLGKKTVRDATYFAGTPNACAMGIDVAEALIQAPEISALVTGAAKLEDSVTIADLKAWWEKTFGLRLFVGENENWAEVVYLFRSPFKEVVNPSMEQCSVCIAMSNETLDIWERDKDHFCREYGVEVWHGVSRIRDYSIYSLTNTLE